MKLIFFSFLLISTKFAFSQTNIRNIDFGALSYKNNWGITSVNYSLGFDWSKKDKKLTNELRYFSFHYNFYKYYKATSRIEFLTYGKGLEIGWRFLFIKPSLNFGLLYSEYNNQDNGFSYTIGVHFNPRIQAGIKYKKIKLSIMANYTTGIGIMKRFNTNGELYTLPNINILLNDEGLMMFTPCISIQI
jgi:hypothetical protein